MEGLNEKVKKLRQSMGWTQEDLAREIGISLSTIQRWEKQGGRPIPEGRTCRQGHPPSFSRSTSGTKAAARKTGGDCQCTEEQGARPVLEGRICRDWEKSSGDYCQPA